MLNNFPTNGTITHPSLDGMQSSPHPSRLDATTQYDADDAELVAQARDLGFVIEGDHRMIEIFRTMKIYARTPLIMRIDGEIGAGKKPCAKAIHDLGHDKEDAPFIGTNCAGLNDGVLESELFGHVKGSFTGAIKDNPGKFRAAEGGTLFLDEIGDATPAQQRRYLSVLEDWEVTPVGENSPVTLKDVKVVAATNQDLEELMRQGKFLEALCSRLSACVIKLPSLAERTIEHRRALVAYRVRHVEKATVPATLTDDALEFLAEQEYRNNVRDLRQAVERAYWLAFVENMEQPIIDLSIAQHTKMETTLRAPNTIPSRRTLRGVQREVILRTLGEYGGHRTLTANALGISVRTLQRKLKAWGLNEEETNAVNGQDQQFSENI